MDAHDLKEYIIENDETVKILEYLDCVDIKESSKEYRCSSPLNENSTALVIRKETLSVKCYSSGSEFKGDIFTLTMKIKELTFSQSLKKIHEILGLKYNGVSKSKENKKDILNIFKKVKNRSIFYDKNLKIYNEDILSEYIQIPYIGWVREGILPNTQKEFQIGYSQNTDRITVPHRYWSGDVNDYVGVMGRTLNEDYDILKIPKYLTLKKFPKTMNLYGLQENYNTIQEAGYVNVFESEKSVLKRHSRNDKTGVAVGCHELSIEQIRILISLDVDIIVIMDKDVDINHIRSMCEPFYGIRNVYYVFDEYGMLKSKESPADKHNKVFNVLWNRKIKYDKTEHDKYLKYMEENNK